MIKFQKYINFKVFLITLFIGLFLNYITLKPPKVVYIYPTPENYNNIQYKDSGNTCFSIKSEEVLCPEKNLISKIPFQKI